MSFHVIFCFAAAAMGLILMQTALESVNGQCTTEGCGHDDLSMNIITEIQQQIVEALGPLNTQTQNIHDVLTASFQQLTSQLNAVMRSLQAVDRRLEEHDIDIKQGQSFHELLNASFQEMKSQHETVNMSLQAVDRRLLEQGQSIHVLLNESFQEMKNLQMVDRRSNEHDVCMKQVQSIHEFLNDIKNQTEKLPRLLNDVCDPAYSVRDCSDIKARFYSANGVYEVCVGHQPNRLCANAYCDMKTTNGTSLVFQRRKDGSVNFHRTWAEYRDGFGNPEGEFWLGNEMLYLLTSKRNYKLRVDLEDWEGKKDYAEYSTFFINSSADNYRLTVSGYSGNAGDSMNYNNGYQFTTINADNDVDGSNCALRYGGAWWHRHCSYANLNNIYHRRYDTVLLERGIFWFHFQNSWTQSLKATEMKLVPVA